MPDFGAMQQAVVDGDVEQARRFARELVESSPQRSNADIIAASALLTTTMEVQAKLARAVSLRAASQSRVWIVTTPASAPHPPSE